MSNIQSLPLRSWISIYGQEGNYWNFVKETDFQRVLQDYEKYRDLYFAMRDIDSVCVEKVKKLEAENKQLKDLLSDISSWMLDNDYDCEREKNKAAFNTYDCLLGDIRRGTIFMKNSS